MSKISKKDKIRLKISEKVNKVNRKCWRKFPINDNDHYIEQLDCHNKRGSHLDDCHIPHNADMAVANPQSATRPPAMRQAWAKVHQKGRRSAIPQIYHPAKFHRRASTHAGNIAYKNIADTHTVANSKWYTTPHCLSGLRGNNRNVVMFVIRCCTSCQRFPVFDGVYAYRKSFNIIVSK